MKANIRNVVRRCRSVASLGAWLWLGASGGAAAVASKVPDQAAPPAASGVSAAAPVRVWSCAVGFPLDSVRFSTERVEQCLAKADPQRIAYMHVVATATATGSHNHNLYLSTRRAGAIEGFLRNRFPDTEIHAFGGGINAKFGKVARIFIVEGGHEEHEEILLAQAVAPKAPLAPVVKYRERQTHLQMAPVMAWGQMTKSGRRYQIAGLQLLAKPAAVRDWLGLSLPDLPLRLGGYYQLWRSNNTWDIHRYGLKVSYQKPLTPSLWGVAVPLVVTGDALLGAMRSQNTQLEASLGAQLVYRLPTCDLGIFAENATRARVVGLLAQVEI